MAEILEVIMIVSFGASWPLNVIKSYKARTTKGKSLAFLLLPFRLRRGDLLMYARNARLDSAAREEASA